MVGDVHDVITCAKYQVEIFMGYDSIRGRIFDFPIDMCSANALFVIMQKKLP